MIVNICQTIYDVSGKTMTLLETRKQYNLSQVDAASAINVSLRTYIRYENDLNYGNQTRRQMMIDALNAKFEITETKGLLTVETIKEIISPLLEKNNISYCYLFGSYAKGSPKESSDVDLLVDTDITGFDYFNLVEDIRVALHKKVDLLRLRDLRSENPIVLEILKEGIRLV